MLRPSDEFEMLLTQKLNAKQAGKQLLLWDMLADKLFDLLLRVFEGCLAQLSPAEMASRMVQPSRMHRNKFRTIVKKSLYDQNGHDFKAEGGAATADTVWEVTAELGVEKCAAVIADAKKDLDEWPNQDLLMG